ncbi:MAG: hypothetical protein JNL50_08010 [Phycisphaerae bacterium]|nr:hypothetical protein [Phycisphaerae bacterium]
MRYVLAQLLVGVAVVSGSALAPAQSTTPASAPNFARSSDPREQARAIAARAAAWLRSQQDASGGWSISQNGPVFPAISGLALAGLVTQPGAAPSDDAIDRAVDFIVKYQQPDGGIYDRILPSYNTSICAAALAKIDTPRAREATKLAIEFLRQTQYGEAAVATSGGSEAAEAVGPEHPFYGGWGYGNRGRPDISNTHFALEALHQAGVPESDPAFRRAISFLQRMQMIERTPDGTKVNDQAYANGSTQGGFIYATAVNKDSVGLGQSFAGEIVEAPSGPPGCEAVFSLEPSVKNALTRDEAHKRLDAAAKGDAAQAAAVLAREFMVVLGPTGDGKSSRDFTIRSPITDPEKFRALVAVAFADVLGEKPAISVRRLDEWQGVSRLRAYGTVSYAGFKSYLYAGLSKDDPRVLAVKDWVTRNYTLEENPGVGTDGLYYYFNVFAPALEANGEETLRVIAADGSVTPRNWRADLVARLATLQEPDGSFRPVDDRWLEDNKVLITAYSLRALQHAAR